MHSLSFRDLGAPVWSWWLLPDAKTGFGQPGKLRPWVLVAELSRRQEFAHAAPRSSKRTPGVMIHPPHHSDHESSCSLDRDGWVIKTCQRPLSPELLDEGRYSCIEPTDQLIRDLEREEE